MSDTWLLESSLYAPGRRVPTSTIGGVSPGTHVSWSRSPMLLLVSRRSTSRTNPSEIGQAFSLAPQRGSQRRVARRSFCRESLCCSRQSAPDEALQLSAGDAIEGCWGGVGHLRAGGNAG